MSVQDRLYNSATDKEWSSTVYQAAKTVIEEVLVAAHGSMPQKQILEAMQHKHPTLCDDSIRDRSYPQMPYWKQLVATAISASQKAGKVSKADGGWIWASTNWSSVPMPIPTSSTDTCANTYSGATTPITATTASAKTPRGIETDDGGYR